MIREKAPSTIAIRLAAADERPSGFDYMRITLAIGVVLFHSFQYCYPGGLDLVWQSWARGLAKFVVPMFFCLSGFLVAGSVERSRTLIKFIGLRVLRIYPALSVEVLLSAFLIGPLVTEVPLRAYFQSPQFFRYLLNVTGDISYLLPGVFTHNPWPNIVNSQLWTVKFELFCYASISGIFLAGKKWLATSILVGIALLSIAVLIWKLTTSGLATDERESGPYLVLFFLAGVLINVRKEKVPHNRVLFWICLPIAFVLLGYVPGGDIIGVYPLSYVTVYLGVINPPRVGVLKTADLSYGVYLYGAVIQQSLIAEFPWSHHWYLNFALTMPPCLAIAWLSWNFIERPALRARKLLDSVETWAIGSPVKRLLTGPSTGKVPK